MTILHGLLLLLPMAGQGPTVPGMPAGARIGPRPAPFAAVQPGGAAVRPSSIIPAGGISVGQLASIFRYNRAEGVSLGASRTTRLGHSSVQGSASMRYAFTDRRLQAEVALRRVGVGRESEVRLFRGMRDADPLAAGLTVGNTWDALLLTHDEGAYVFGEGGELMRRHTWQSDIDLTVMLRVARESSPRITARSDVNDVLGGDGLFPPNEPVAAGTYSVVSAELQGGTQEDLQWRTGVELTAGDASHARGWAQGTARREIGAGLDMTVSGWLGAGSGARVTQRFFRLGGTASLRGSDAGSFRGPSAWSAGVDLGAAHRIISPIVFLDVGQVSVRGLSFEGSPSSSAGVGVSVMRGMIRLHVATPLDQRTDWRFDLLVGSRR